MDQVKKIAIVGVGLIGGSFSLGLKAAGFRGEVLGVGRDANRLKSAQKLGILDGFQTSYEGLQEADLIFLATPVGTYDTIFRALGQLALGHTIITDAGSSKQSFLRLANEYLADASFCVPAHPIAGKENSGFEYAGKGLFQGHVCILTPDEQTNEDAVKCVQGLWEACGSQVELMGAAQHDRILAVVSHLPHVLSYALVATVCRQRDAEHDPFDYAAGGFRDFTRIASSSPDMWRDIVLSNKDEMLAQIGRFGEILAEFEALLVQDDGDGLMRFFIEAKQARDSWSHRSKDHL